jgi:hypothetical protein
MKLLNELVGGDSKTSKDFEDYQGSAWELSQVGLSLLHKFSIQEYRIPSAERKLELLWRAA